MIEDSRDKILAYLQKNTTRISNTELADRLQLNEKEIHSVINKIVLQKPEFIKTEEISSSGKYVVWTPSKMEYDIDNFIMSGGFAQLDKQAHKEAGIRELTNEKLKYDLKNAKWISKTYKFTFFFSIVAFAYATFQLIKGLIEFLSHYKP